MANVKEYKGLSGKIYRLEDQIGKGGEGAVYKVQGEPRFAAKIYNGKKSKSEMDELFEKLKVMVDMKFNPYLDGMIIATWPQDVLLDENGEFVGYIMPRISKQKSLVVACRPSERSTMLFGEDYTWMKSIATAYNLALMVDCMHRAGIVIGDMNANNILVNSHAQVTLIDCDSFQVRSPKDGKLYKCTVGLPETEPPEVQGRDMRKPGNEFTEYSDRYALAIHIFALLCNGFHPFNVIKPKTRGSSTSGNKSTQVKNITSGYCPYIAPADKAQLPMEAPDMGMLPDYIMELFRRAFGYDASTAVLQSTLQNRPTAAEWRAALERLFNESMTTCSKHKEHVYRTAYGKCPWCEAEANTRAPKQPSKVAATVKGYNQKVLQKYAPARAAAAAQRAANVTTPRNWTYTPGTYRRDANALYLLCLIVGMVGTAMPVQAEIGIIQQIFGYTLSMNVMTVINVLFGLAAGWAVAAWAKERYLRAVNAWPWLWVSLAAPLVAWAGMALTALAILVVVVIVYIIAIILGLIFALAILAGS